MNPRANANCQRASLWIYLVSLIVTFVGLWPLAKFIPPPSPSLTSAEVVALYQTDTNLKRLGFVLALAMGPFFAFLTAGISVQMKRIEADMSPILTYANLVLGGVTSFLGVLVAIFWVTAAFRPERPPDVTVVLHDLGWLAATMVIMAIFAEYLVIAAAVFLDESREPVFPRWYAYVCLWAALSALPANVIVFFRQGVFAWNGALGFWLPIALFAVWVNCTSWVLLQAIRREEELLSA